MRRVVVGLAVIFLVAAVPMLAGIPPVGAQEKAATTKSSAKPAKQKEVFDINSATKAELETLKGIGPVHADAIIKGRPYNRKDDLVRKKIITREVYDSIKLKILAKRS